MNKIPQEVPRAELPARFLSLVNKVENTIDFESTDSPQTVQVYGHNNTMMTCDIDSWLSQGGNIASHERVANVLTMLCCNENLMAVGYVLCAMKVDLDPDTLADNDEIQSMDDLRRYVKKHNLGENAQPTPALLAGYETREGIWQGVASLEIPNPEDLSTGEIGQWRFTFQTQKEVRAGQKEASNDARALTRGFFAGAHELLQTAGRWA